MKKELILMRHADASHQLPDKERPLSELGKKQASEVGQLLRQGKMQPDLLVSSSALRAQMTAQIISEYLDYKKQDILIDHRWYDADNFTLIDLICAFPDAKNSIVVVAHNPGLSVLAKLLTRDSFSQILSTAGLVHLSFQIDSWKEVQSAPHQFSQFLEPDTTTSE